MDPQPTEKKVAPPAVESSDKAEESERILRRAMRVIPPALAARLAKEKAAGAERARRQNLPGAE